MRVSQSHAILIFTQVPKLATASPTLFFTTVLLSTIPKSAQHRHMSVSLSVGRGQGLALTSFKTTTPHAMTNSLSAF